MKTGMEAALADVQHAAELLIRTAEDIGVVLTIEQVPLEPLAMGHYKTVARVRIAREL